MRVMCVKDLSGNADIFCTSHEHPQVGDEDVVIGTLKRYGQEYYILSRFNENAFRVDYFATLPEQTADELLEEKSKTLAA